ncbi:MAG: hypothetical protein H6668_14705 [Ardenticatenaceae bacterium]|nr:hypothetical protein [Ardenticatenaceae bacterium]
MKINPLKKGDQQNWGLISQSPGYEIFTKIEEGLEEKTVLWAINADFGHPGD